MIPIYEESTDHIQIYEKKAVHFPPHLHKSIEIVSVTKGSLVIGTGVDLYEMKEGDLAIVFPNLIHHYQVFRPDEDNRDITLLASPSYFGGYEEILQSSRPENPVIAKANVHPDVSYALMRLKELNGPGQRQNKRARSGRKRVHHAYPAHGHKRTADHTSPNPEDKILLQSQEAPSRSLYALNHAYIQIILARAIPLLPLQPRGDIKEQDIVYQTVAYVSSHYAEDMSQEAMAADLGISPYALSRVFSKIFHQNFNHYLNEVRLEHVAVLLTESNEPVTDICYDCGFQSQATFNRVFQEKYHMTPREYRRQQTG